MSAFFGNMMIALKTSISSTATSAAKNGNTDIINASVTGGRGTYSYLWNVVDPSFGVTPFAPSLISTYFYQSGPSYTDCSTNVYCAVTDNITGNTLNTPNCTITWGTPSGSIAQGSPTSGTSTPCTATLTGATASGYAWTRVSGVTCTFSPSNTATTTVNAPTATTGQTTIVRCTITYSGGSVAPQLTITWGLL